MQNHLELGRWNVICDVCGRKFKNTDVRKRWDGLVVCDKDYETRHIADFIKPNVEHNNVRDARPEQADVFVTVNFIDTGDTICVPGTQFAIAGIGVAGCMVAGKLNPGGL